MRVEPPAWAALLHRVEGRIIRPRPDGRVPLHVAIDAHKALTGPFVLALMAMYDTYTTAAWIYLGLHGAYGIAWVIKDLVVPDRRFHRRVSLLGATGALLFLSLYWVAPILLVTGAPGSGWSPAPPFGLAIAVAVHTLGVVLMIGSDGQKNAALATMHPPGRTAGGVSVGSGDPEAMSRSSFDATTGPGRLITTGFFRHVRHPNYLGEMLIYGSYALIVNHWLPWVILAAVWLLYFLPNMLVIEASLSRYPEFEGWRRRTGFLLPRIR
jgi:hypothetical protein